MRDYKDKYKQHFHIFPQVGLLNDPNGLYKKDGVYHVFHQWNPQAPVHGVKWWKEWISDDLLHWYESESTLKPSEWYDVSGVYSGTALVEEEQVYFYYTGNVRKGDHRFSFVCCARREVNGKIEKIRFPLISKIPQQFTSHFRDPKVWKEKNHYYMMIGAQTKDLKGTIVFYQSENRLQWNQSGEIKLPLLENCYMIECPDYIRIGQEYVLFCCPQFEIDGVRESLSMVSISDCFDFSKRELKVLDHGFDFYAPQTMWDEENNRYILIGWLGKPDHVYEDANYGWTGSLSLPRELSIDKERQQIVQRPVKEIENAKQFILKISEKERYSIQLECKGYNVTFSSSDPYRFIISGDERNFEVHYNPQDYKLMFKYNHQVSSIEIDDSVVDLDLYLDASSIEVFINNGQYVFSSRIFLGSDITIGFTGNECDEISLYQLNL